MGQNGNRMHRKVSTRDVAHCIISRAVRRNHRAMQESDAVVMLWGGPSFVGKTGVVKLVTV